MVAITIIPLLPQTGKPHVMLYKKYGVEMKLIGTYSVRESGVVVHLSPGLLGWFAGIFDIFISMLSVYDYSSTRANPFVLVYTQGSKGEDPSILLRGLAGAVDGEVNFRAFSSVEI
ncbi:hypothetical protein M0657_002538 [Pyricularia oryzae]|nr:hypothetical protein M0657_002538 [Pyricularia oryzae]